MFLQANAYSSNWVLDLIFAMTYVLLIFLTHLKNLKYFIIIFKPFSKKFKYKTNTENNKSSIYEYEYNQLLSNLGFNVPNMKLVGRDILLSERFDRLNDERVFYLSAMLMIGSDEANKSNCDLSYLNIAFSFDEQFGDKMLVVANEIWKRALANVLLGNTDDHLRNHAFLRVNGQFVMSPMFDVTPCLYNSNIYNREHVLSIVDGGEKNTDKNDGRFN